MWQAAAAILGVPAAIRHGIEVIDRMIRGLRAAQQGNQEATQELVGIRTNFVTIRGAVEALVTDVVELAAYKQLHTTTNQFSIDLRQTFMTDSEDDDWGQTHLLSNRKLILSELRSMWEGQRAGGQLAALRTNQDYMCHLEKMPIDVAEKLNGSTWDELMWSLPRKAVINIRNYDEFRICIGLLRGLNFSLNNYANRMIEGGIGDLARLMSELREALRNTDMGGQRN